jgi:hypothetical protein
MLDTDKKSIPIADVAQVLSNELTYV